MASMHFGTAALSSTTALRLGLQLLVLPILARLIGPEGIGLVALATPIVLFATLFSDAGLCASVVRVPVLTRELESSAYWISAMAGAVLAGVVFVSAGTIAGLLGNRDLAPLLHGLAPILLFSSLCTVPSALIQRRQRLVVFAIGDLASAFTGAATALYCALTGWGAWSLVAQQLVFWATKCVVSTVGSGLQPRLRCRLHDLTGHLSFGAWVLASSVNDFIARNIDNVLIGSLIGVEQLGYYAMAYQIIRLPDMLLLSPVSVSVFPGIARVATDSRKVAEIYLRCLRSVALQTVPALVGLALTADLAVGLLLGERWSPTAPVLAILTALGLVQCLLSINTALLLGIGRSDVKFKLSVLTTASYVAGILVGSIFGIVGVALGLAIAAFAVAIPCSRVTARQIGLPSITIFWAIWPAVAACIVMASVVAGIRWTAAHEDMAAIPDLILAVAGGAVTYAGVLMIWFGRRLPAQFRIAAGIVPRPS